MSPTTPRSLFSRMATHDALLFTVLLAFHLALVWAFPYFPTQDGPLHVGNARMLQEYSRPEGAVFRQYFSLSPHIEDNWPGHLALIALFQVFAPLTAEKVLLSGYVLLFALCARWTLAAFGRPALFLAVLLFPFIHNFTLHMGFYAFNFSLILFLFILGYWLRRCDTWRRLDTVYLAVLLTATYFLHPASFVMSVMFLPLLAATLPSSSGAQLRRLWRIYSAGLASLPGALLLVHYLLTHESAASGWTLTTWERLRYFITLGYLRSFGRSEVALCLLYLLLLGATALVSRQANSNGRRWRMEHALAALAGLCVLLYLAAPDELGKGSFITARLMFYPLILSLLWLAARSYSPRAMQAVRTAGTGLIILWLGFHAFQHAGVQARIGEYLAVTQFMRSGATLLAIHQRPAREWYIDPIANITGYYASERNLVPLDNYQATTDHFPLRFRPECDPVPLLGRPPWIELRKYNALPGCRVDYVVLFGEPQGPAAAHLHRELSAYHAVSSSPTPSLWRLYEKGPP